MKSKGFTLIEVLIVVAILGIIAAVLIPNIDSFLKSKGNWATNETAVTNNETTFRELAVQPISSLNLTELEFMIEYCLSRSIHYVGTNEWLDKVIVYQNQVIINELKEQP